LNDESIEQIDSEIMELIADRLAVARRIGAAKVTTGKKIRQPETEKKVKERIEGKAKELGLSEDDMQNIFAGIIEASVAEQEKLEASVKERKDIGKCVIYGGAGGMGKILSEMLHMHGYEVTVVRSTGAVLKYPSLEKGAIPEDADFAIVSVPMRITGDMIITASNQVPGKRIYEICSMKSRLKTAISRVEKSGSEVISLHPMFGPGIRAIREKPVIFCGKPDQFKEDPIWKAFEAEGARLLTVPFDDHDKLMSYVLQFTHAMNIIYFTVLSNSGIDISLLQKAASPICAKQIFTAKRVSVQDPQLYFEIQRLSDHLGDMYEQLGVAQAELVEALASESSAKFKQLMEKGKKYFDGGGKVG
jgi:chorismate mutase/prephenate dehydrogenase